jgi:hypothetical protein
MADKPIKEGIQELEEKFKLELKTYPNNKELNVEVLTKILNIPLVDVQNILGVENK